MGTQHHKHDHDILGPGIRSLEHRQHHRVGVQLHNSASFWDYLTNFLTVGVHHIPSDSDRRNYWPL